MIRARRWELRRHVLRQEPSDDSRITLNWLPTARKKDKRQTEGPVAENGPKSQMALGPNGPKLAKSRSENRSFVRVLCLFATSGSKRTFDVMMCDNLWQAFPRQVSLFKNKSTYADVG